jgi:glycosyltransferase involved in cell wall biosynthesis
VSGAHAQEDSRPLVSVILPTRDRLTQLRRAVSSVCAQSERRLELIVVDDGSTDGTWEYLERLPAEEGRIRVVRNAVSMGGSGARNEGIRLSRGKWLAFIDDDDEWLPQKLERQLQTLAQHTAAVACSCGYLVRSASRVLKVSRVQPGVTVQELLVANRLGGASMCVCSGATLTSIGGFDAKLKSAQDLDLWVRLRRAGEVAVCSEPLVVHWAHSGPRITTNTQSQYAGLRRFHFKHRSLMSAATRRHRLAHSCYLMSTQDTRPLRRRLRYLAMAMLNASPRVALAFAKRSAPRLVQAALSRGGARSGAQLPTPPRTIGK